MEDNDHNRDMPRRDIRRDRAKRAIAMLPDNSNDAALDRTRAALAYQLDLELHLRAVEEATLAREIARVQSAISALRLLQATGQYPIAVQRYASWSADLATAQFHAALAPLSRAPTAIAANHAPPLLPTRPSASPTSAAAQHSLVLPPPPLTLPPPFPIPRAISPRPLTTTPDDVGLSRTTTSSPFPAADAQEHDPALFLFEQRTDGRFVQMICPTPECGCTAFANVSEFQSHCLSEHAIRYPSAVHAVAAAGVVVPDSAVPQPKKVRALTGVWGGGDSSSASTTLPPGSSDTSAATRFYAHRKLKYGNVSKSLLVAGPNEPVKVPAPGTVPTHAWMVYVVAPKWVAEQNLGAYITRVRFTLDPSYAPNHIVDVTRPPFQVKRKGWGEFSVAVEVFFVDAAKNRPLVLSVPLKLDRSWTGREMQGFNDEAEVKLDRDTDLNDRRDIYLHPDRYNAVLQGLASPKGATETAATAPPPLASPPPMSAVEKESLLFGSGTRIPECASQFLTSYAQEWPLVKQRVPPGLQVPWRIARSLREWESWPLARRQAAEWLRARRMARAVAKFLLPSLSPEDCQSVLDAGLSVKRILHWCRIHEHSPLPYPTWPVVPAALISDSSPSASRENTSELMTTEPIVSTTVACAGCGLWGHQLESCTVAHPMQLEALSTQQQQLQHHPHQRRSSIDWSECQTWRLPYAGRDLPTASLVAKWLGMLPQQPRAVAATVAASFVSRPRRVRSWDLGPARVAADRTIIKKSGSGDDDEDQNYVSGSGDDTSKHATADVTLAVLATALRLFVHRLAGGAVAVAREQRRAVQDQEPATPHHARQQLLVPNHLLMAAQRDPLMDFLMLSTRQLQQGMMDS
ncbi:hypothetical protein BC828DRAFT_374884 [Blastocladiella britannica]|nr:hypothetical protein BC828DRAFT_374884 [Blastocladiella britannica]